MLPTMISFLQLLYPLLVLCQVLSVSPRDVGHLLPLSVLQSCQFMLVFIHLPAHLLPQLLFQSTNNIRVSVSVSLRSVQLAVRNY